jgi:hypothetical protein
LAIGAFPASKEVEDDDEDEDDWGEYPNNALYLEVDPVPEHGMLNLTTDNVPLIWHLARIR